MNFRLMIAMAAGLLLTASTLVQAEDASANKAQPSAEKPSDTAKPAGKKRSISVTPNSAVNSAVQSAVKSSRDDTARRSKDLQAR
jgi:hypothetical protein